MVFKPVAPAHTSYHSSPNRLMKPPSTPNLRTVGISRPKSSSPSSSSQCSSPVRSCSTRTASPIRNARSSYQGTISVGVRIKPTKGKHDTWHINNNSIIHEEFGEFSFDHVFSPEMNNDRVYETMALPMVDKLFEGYNCTIFAYGMTGSGKTYTMSGSESGPGIIPMCVDSIFNRINVGVPRKKFTVRVSYLEIYNERIYDLLNIPQAKAMNSNIMVPNSSLTNDLKLRDDLKYGVKVVGLVERDVNSNEELMKCISIGDHNRKTGETDFNSRSSRSHAVVLIRVFCVDETTGEQVMSTLSLCDLAGSERATGQHERRKEGAYINKSLLALGTVISKLSMESSGTSTNASHIPYRDSNLTRILQPALSGDSLVATICTVDTRPDTSTESMNTIRFASRAKNISLNVKRNEADSNLSKSQIIQALKKQVREQQTTIDNFTRGKSSTGTQAVSDSLLQKENYYLKMKVSHYEKLETLEPTILTDPELVEIIEMLPHDIGAMLETKLANIDSRLQEMKSYVSQLEFNKARFVSDTSGTAALLSTATDIDLTQVLHEQERELMQLHQSIQRKDKMIEALKSAKRLKLQLAEYTGNTEITTRADLSSEGDCVASKVLQPISPNANDLNKQERPFTVGSRATLSTSTTTSSSGNPDFFKPAPKYSTASDLNPTPAI